MANEMKANKKGTAQDDLAALIAKIQANSNNAYKAPTQKEINDQANLRYGSKYNQLKLAATQAYETQDQALANQLAGLQSSYDEQRQQSEEAYDNAYRQADRQSANRGMQRSSYNNATLSNINNEGLEARQKINEAQTLHQNDIEAQRATLARQLTQQHQQYDAQKQDDVQAYIDERNQQEYERQMAAQQQANNLAMQLYQFQYQQHQDQQEQANWQAQFDAQYGGKSGRSNGSGGGGTDPKPSSGTDLFSLLASVLGSNGQNSGSNIGRLMNQYPIKKPTLPRYGK